ncbi:ABC transporter ATP-binding protein [Roseburia sp. CLA-AA-H204]|uniref:ABC transporter ATP-binding protein n=1 Tax=Roseburia amylophila TaxID=2981794 RepID=A0AAW4WE83_9FIRM|nr:ABC transporter ATP-binding protein [Roseburia amylophila]
MIEISHLTKKYGTHVAVDDLNLTIEPGRIYGFLGPNGAGKSTTMNMITGYLGATEGIIKINGFDILAQPEDAKKCIGYLPELPPLYMDMTVEEYLLFAAELKKIPKEKRKPYVEDAMATTKITDMRGRLIKNLSKGYRQRVGLAQAVLGYPEVIILDEPTVGLDPKQIIEIRDLIQSLGKKHTVILSSHILSEVRAVCDYIFIISHGKLVASEETEDLVERMSGGQVIELKLKAEEEKVKEVFADAEHITAVETKELPEDGVTEVTVTAEKNKDVREEIFHICAESDMPILEMINGGKSLEDIFLELTSKEEE